MALALASFASTATGQGAAPQGPIPQLPPTWPVSPYSTHDWTDQTSSSLLPEVWVDTKTPGDGRTYSVGTVLATNLDSSVNSPNPPTFSGVAILSPILPNQSYVTNGARAVAVLQCATPPSAAHPSGIVWQRFFFGNPPIFGGLPNNFVAMSCHARAISVFPAATPSATRIAICGESYDESLPGDPTFQRTNYTSAGGIVGGFLAVYDGDGALLWSRLYSGSDPLNATTLTDISIRTETVSTANGNVLRDVVTFCGVTQCGYYGNPNLPTARRIDPVNAFAPPPAHPQGHATIAGGATHNGPSPTTQSSEWDGLIGRDWENQIGYPSGSGTDFLCLVGGAFQDGLYGISEIDSNNFAVVGSTARLSRGAAGGAEFPLTRWATFNDVPSTPPFNSFNEPWFQFGTLLVFDATATRSNGNLALIRSELLGSRGSSTVARDVLAQGQMLYVAGSTNDPGFCMPFFNGANKQLDGPTDGFLLATAHLLPIEAVTFVTATGTGNADELTGIAGWNEFADNVIVVGRQWTSAGAQDVFTTKLFLDTTAGTYTAGLPTDFRSLRGLVVPGSGREVIADCPTLFFTGQAHGWAGSGTATGVGGPFEFGPLQSNPFLAIGAPFGGGVGVDKHGRTTIVGGTSSADYRVEGGGRNVSVWAAVQANVDAVRTEVDLLPQGVCRTDRTSGFLPPVYAPASGDGGTTPVTALSPFGNQIGTPAPLVQRMLIDFEGDCAAGAPAAILIDRPPAPSSSVAYASFLQFGTPGPAPVSIPNMPGVEVWTTNSPATTSYVPHEGTLRIPLWSGGLPVGSYAFTVQFFAALTGPVPFVASPALIFAY